jgi:hypothetical protein
MAYVHTNMALSTLVLWSTFHQLFKSTFLSNDMKITIHFANSTEIKTILLLVCHVISLLSIGSVESFSPDLIMLWQLLSVAFLLWQLLSVAFMLWQLLSAAFMLWQLLSAAFMLWQLLSAAFLLWQLLSVAFMLWQLLSADFLLWQLLSVAFLCFATSFSYPICILSLLDLLGRCIP